MWSDFKTVWTQADGWVILLFALLVWLVHRWARARDQQEQDKDPYENHHHHHW